MDQEGGNAMSWKNTVADLGKTAVAGLRRFLDAITNRPVSPAQKLAELLVLKYLYIFLSVMILAPAWYHGPDGYHVNFIFWKELLSSVVFTAVAVFYLRSPIRDAFIKNLMLFLFVLYYIPLNSAYAINDQTFGFFLLSNLYFALLVAGVIFLDRFIAKRKKPRRLKGRNEKSLVWNRTLNLFCFIMCLLYILHKLSYNGLEFSISMANDDVYSTRATYSEYLQKIGGSLYSYLLAIVRYMISYVTSYYLISGLIRRKPVAVITSVVTILSMYSVSSQKSTLLVPVLVVAVYFFRQLKVLKRFDRIFIFGMLALLLVCLAEHFLLRSDSIFTLIIRRQMYIPSWLNTLYYEFFSQNDKVLWSDSVIVMQNLLEPVYDQSVLELINNTYFQGEVPSPNTGMFAEAYMHFGVLGALLYPGLLSVFFTVLARIYKKYGLTIQITLAVRLALTLTNVPITRTDAVLSVFAFSFVLWIVPALKLDEPLARWFDRIKAGKGKHNN